MTTATQAPSSRPAMPIFRRHLFVGRRGLLGWSLGIAAAIVLYLPVYPSLQTPELTDMINSLPGDLVSTLGFDEIATGAGYTQATFFGLLGFALAVIAGTAWGSQFIAGTEETGRLELTLAHAVGRAQYALESVAALAAKLATLGVVAFVLILIMNSPIELELSVGNLVAVTLAWVSLSLLSGMAALAVGALSGRRAWAVGAGAGVAVLSYGFDAVGGTSADLDWLASISPYHWAFGDQPLANGFDWMGLGLLWAAAALLVALTSWALARRDIGG